MVKRLAENIKSALSENNIGLTICFILFLGPLVYFFLKHTPLGSVIITVIIGISCYIWGYLRGGKAKRIKSQLESGLNDSQLQDNYESTNNNSDLD